MQLLSEDASCLSKHVSLPIPSADRVRDVQDKSFVLGLARQLGMGVPQIFTASGTTELRRLAGRLEYPVVIKPRLSWFLRNENWSCGQVEYAHNPQELLAIYQRSDATIPAPLIQEHVKGEGMGIFLLIWDGELKAMFSHRRIREKPPSGGVSVYSESVPANLELVGKCHSLLRQIGWQGPAMLEFKVDRKTGDPKLMEINGRFWGSLQLAVSAGVNFPLVLYRLAMGDDVEPQLEYRIGVKNRWLLGDLQRLITALRENSDVELGTSLRMCADFFPLYEKDGHLEDVQLSDLGPLKFQWNSAVKSAWQRLVGRRPCNRPHAACSQKHRRAW